jgi:hypothetical protein
LLDTWFKPGTRILPATFNAITCHAGGTQGAADRADALVARPKLAIKPFPNKPLADQEKTKTKGEMFTN